MRLFYKSGGFWNWLKYTGLWIPIPFTGIIITATHYLVPDFIWTPETILALLVSTLIIPVYIWSLNNIAKSNGKEQFPLFPFNTGKDPLYQVSHRTNAMYKKPPQELLFSKPQGIVLGRYHSKYVCLIPDGISVSHCLCIGSSGSGKTSTIMADFLLSKHIARSKKKKPIPVIMVDVKGELEQKFFYPDTDDLVVFNPRRRDLWGWDFFYDINENSSEEKILDTLQRIVFSLIPVSQNQNSDRFWVDAPRNILLGLFLFGFQNKGLRNLPDLADFVCSSNLKKLINDVLLEVDEYSTVGKILNPFGGENAAEETLSGISMTIANALRLISTDETLRFLLRESDRKINPAFVDRGISIDLQIEDTYLPKYARILAAILGSCNFYLCSRPEGSQPVQILLDEVGRLVHEGQLEGLQQNLQLGRSKGCGLILCLQQWSAMQASYSEATSRDMLTNIPFRLVMHCSPDDRETVEMCKNAFGKYQERKKSIGIGKNSSTSYSFEEKDVLLEKDLLTLPQTNRVVLLSPYGAYFLKRCPYYKDPILKRIANDIKAKRQARRNTDE